MLRRYLSRFSFCIDSRTRTQLLVEQADNHQNKLTRHFIDRIKLKAVAGNGGNGCIHYFADRYVARGPPDGGCGGEGGDIILQANRGLLDLSHFRKKTLVGNDGDYGKLSGKNGKRGGKTVYRVPVGTLVYEIIQDQETVSETKRFLIDLDTNDKQYVIARGGAAGKGNKRYPTLDRTHRLGKPGEQRNLYLQLKTMADVGLVGLPNIGKSTFLAAVSRALPKIANYEFTTLNPSLGIVKFVDGYQISVADIPGIIEDAHQNKGLGLEFLRHIERTKVLAYMLDLSRPNPLEQLRLLKHELVAYNPKFKQRRSVVIFNKMDTLSNSQQLFEKWRKQISEPSYLVSAKLGDGLGDVVIALRQIITEIQRVG